MSHGWAGSGFMIGPLMSDGLADSGSLMGSHISHGWDNIIGLLISDGSDRATTLVSAGHLMDHQIRCFVTIGCILRDRIFHLRGSLLVLCTLYKHSKELVEMSSVTIAAANQGFIDVCWRSIFPLQLHSENRLAKDTRPVRDGDLSPSAVSLETGLSH
jgi:hypothetical protein